MLSKVEINEIKGLKNGEMQNILAKIKNDNNSVIFLLANLGFLPKDFDGAWLADFLQNKNSNIRYWAVKNIGKLEDENFLETLNTVILTDNNSEVRREAVSSIGRLRSKNSIKYLFSVLTDKDPKVVSQAIRGLLVFKGDEIVDRTLKKLENHENEMISRVIKKEYFVLKERDRISLPHPVAPSFLKNVTVLGDTNEIMKLIPEDSIHLTFTSPPYYNARDYSIYGSYKEYLKFLENTFLEIHRITKEGRFFVLNTSPIIEPRVSRQHSSIRYPIPFDLHALIMNMDWEFIDDIVWVKPEASAKDRNSSFRQHRKPLAYKANAITEYLMVYRKKTDKLIDWNIKQYDHKTINDSKVIESDIESKNTWDIDPTWSKKHTAVFPIELCNRVIKYYSFKEDLIFDPFAGSGTLGKAALNLGRNFFMTEKDTAYFERIKEDFRNIDLFRNNDLRFYNKQDFSQTIPNQNGNNNRDQKSNN
ncbi:MAG: HEAT repeat domain-containing protein [Ignavibacteria bacterium]|nr:HEAT repeat domain-containing protein [Ignavibacteria bacterium]